MTPFQCPCGIQFDLDSPPRMCQGCPLATHTPPMDLWDVVAECGPPLFGTTEWTLLEVDGEDSKCPARVQLLENDHDADIYGDEYGNWGH